VVGDRPVWVPVGQESARWVTVAAERTVLAVARTVTSTLRVLEAVASLSSDPRVQVVFSINDSSPFAAGVQRLLGEMGAAVVPWSEATRLSFDLVVTASENTELAGLDAPVLVLPHGVGFQKVLPDSRGAGSRLSGSLRPVDVRDRRVVLAVSHPDQAAQLVAHSPFLAGMTVVVVDPVFERLTVTAWFRDRYRAALGIGDRGLVVLSSTWGRESLLGRWPDLPVRLLAELSADEHLAGVVLHPNIWSGHGPWQVRSWLARARDAGLMVMPPEGSWPAMLVAADCLIGDHGSVSLYAAAADRAILLAPLGGETVPGTAISMLSAVAPRLDVRGSLRDQVIETVGEHFAGRYGKVTAKAFAGPPTARPVRSLVYELLMLAEPSHEPALAGHPLPEPERTRPGAYAVYTRQFDGGVDVRRVPASVDAAATAPLGWERHLAVDEHEWDLRLLHSAAILVAPEPSDQMRERAVLARLPGADMSVAPSEDGAVVTMRDGGHVEVHDPERRWDPMLLGAVTRAVLHSGSPMGPTLVKAGGRASRIHLRGRN